MSIQIKRGMKKDLPQLKDGELAFCRDTKELYVGNNGNENVSVTKKIEDRLDAVDSQLAHIPSLLFSKYNIDNTGLSDTTDNFKTMLNNENYIYLAKGVYKVSDLAINNKTIIGEIGTKILVDTNKDYQEFALYCSGKNYFENIIFELKDTATRTALVSLHNATDNVFINCNFDCFDNGANSSKTPVDIYQNSQNIKFINCTINAMSNGSAGGVWVRNISPEIEKCVKNISFDNCIFNKMGGDEVIAVWGWKGYLENIYFTRCTINGYKSDFKNPSHFITLGMGGTSNNIIMDSCKIYVEYPSSTNGHSIIKSFKDVTTGGAVDHGKIGNGCKILNCTIEINSLKDSDFIVFRCDKQYWENYIISGCDIIAHSSIRRLTSGNNKIQGCNIKADTVLDSMFASTDVVENNIVEYNKGKLFTHCAKINNNNIYIHNTSDNYVMQFIDNKDIKYIFTNNTIKLETQSQSIFANDKTNIALDLLIQGNNLYNIGFFINTNPSSKIRVINNTFENATQKTILGGEPIIASNIVNNEFKQSGL